MMHSQTMLSHLNTFVADVSCPICHTPITRVRSDPRGVELPHCCGLYWIPKWKILGGKLQVHLTYYRPEGMANEKYIIHENEIQEDPKSTDTPPTRQKNREHNIEHSDPLKPTRQKNREHNIEHNEKAIAIEFLSTHIVAAPEHFETTDDIYLSYQMFAETRNRTPLEDRKLYALLRERYTVEKTRRRVNRKLVYGFIGIRCDTQRL